MCNQEMYWLVQAKRAAIQHHLIHHTDGVAGILTSAIVATTGEPTAVWEPPAEGPLGVADRVGAHVVACSDANKGFKVNIQEITVSYKKSGLAPVPDSIARRYDFRRYFKGKVPHCAAVANRKHCQTVRIIQGDILLRAWSLPKKMSMYRDLPGCPTVVGVEDNKALTFESAHPYKDNEERKETVRIAGADALIITFDPDSHTEAKYDKLTLSGLESKPGNFVSEDGTVTLSGKTGDESGLWDKTFRATGDSFSFHWRADGSGQNGDGACPGFTMFVEKGVANTESQAYSYGGVTYGGEGRTYMYGREAPPDIPWLSKILDPVLFSELTEENDNGEVGWREFKDAAIEDGSQLRFMLPTERAESNDLSTVTLLGLSETGNFWRILQVSRCLECVDVFVVDALGRRAFPRQTYSSDSRMAMGGIDCDPKKQHNAPPSSIVRFAAGRFLGSPIGGGDVVITVGEEIKEGKVEPTGEMYVPDEYLHGTLPSALAENFEFWQDQATGDIEGRQEQLQRRTEKGTLVPFVHPFFDYNVEMRCSPRCSSVVRVDKDVISGEDHSKSLINLRNAPRGSATAEIVRILSQIESLSHILAWTPHMEETGEAGKAAAHAAASSAALRPDIIECPRLRVRFKATYTVEGHLDKLFVVDRGSIHVVPDGGSVVNPVLMAGLPRALVLSDASHALEIMVPNYPLVRPQVTFCPFTTSCVPRSSDWQWRRACDARYFSYEVHP